MSKQNKTQSMLYFSFAAELGGIVQYTNDGNTAKNIDGQLALPPTPSPSPNGIGIARRLPRFMCLAPSPSLDRREGKREYQI